MGEWDAEQYTKFERERTQPSVDLIHRIEIQPGSVLDLGCGPGNSTNQLAKAFPGAEILGVDSSDNMLQKAEKAYPGMRFSRCVIPDGLGELGTYDLLFSNACLHWVPDHGSLFPKLMEKLNKGGVLAVQMPLTREAVFYKILHELVSHGKWEKLNSVHNFHSLSPRETYDILCQVSEEVTMWETTYYHIVPSHSAVIEWYRGSGLKPYLDRLGEAERAEFLAELLELVSECIPVQTDNNVILKMPRLFFTARK